MLMTHQWNYTLELGVLEDMLNSKGFLSFGAHPPCEHTLVFKKGPCWQFWHITNLTWKLL